MNPADLSVQAKVMLSSGDLAEVVAVNEGDYTVQIRYLDNMGDPSLVGSEAWISADEVIALDHGGHSEGLT